MRMIRSVRFGRQTEPAAITPAMRWFALAYQHLPCTCHEMPIPEATCAGCVARRWSEASA